MRALHRYRVDRRAEDRALLPRVELPPAPHVQERLRPERKRDGYALRLLQRCARLIDGSLPLLQTRDIGVTADHGDQVRVTVGDKFSLGGLEPRNGLRDTLGRVGCL